MAKNRYLNTYFWSDIYIQDLDPSEKLLYIYLLTNEFTNISGIYEISVRRIAFDTGIDRDMVIKIINRFEVDGKIKYLDGKIAIKNFIKHQSLNPKICKGIAKELKKAPDELFEFIEYDEEVEAILENNYEFKRSKVRGSMRLKIFERDKYTCQLCGKTKEDIPIEIDHILPVSMGGTNKENNLRTLCRECNQGRHNKVEIGFGSLSHININNNINNNINTKGKSCKQIIGLPLNTGKEYPITDEQIKEWSDTYPAVDILMELKRMVQWCNANKNKRKTNRGILRFITTWLGRTQDRGGNNGRGAAGRKPKETKEEFLKRMESKSTKGVANGK